jgi:uncharacterized protein (TIGR03067 family)
MEVTLLLAATAVLVTPADAKDDKIKNELKKFEGNWTMSSGEVEGKKVAAEHVKKSKITWKGKKVSLLTPHQSKEEIRAEAVLDPTKKPKRMEWVRSVGPNKGKKMLAIYEFIDDDTYRVCFAAPGKKRPTKFETKVDSGHTLHVWKRVKD